MKIKNCAECGRVFVHPSRDICPLCYESEEEDFVKVKEYLWDKASSSVDVVHEKTGVSKERIIKFIRQGRILAAGLMVELLLACERCGEPITEGQYCQKCRDELIKGLTEEEVVKEDEPEGRHQPGKMHITRRLK